MPDALGAKQMAALADLANADLIVEAAAGLPFILASAKELAAAAGALTSPHERAKAILAHHAQEEAAKGLMLLDLLRCPERRQEDRRRLAKSFYDHLSRAIYAEACDWRPADFGEVRRCVEGECERYFLDGPNDVDWIFLNSAINERESLLYADRVRLEDGYRWQAAGGPFGTVHQPSSAALDVLEAIAGIGAFDAGGLTALAETWDGLEIVDETHWQTFSTLNRTTLLRFEALGLLNDRRSDDIAKALEWPMPLYPLDLRVKRTDLVELQRRQAAWTP